MKLNQFESYIMYLNKKSYTASILNVKENGAGQKRSQTQISKGQPNKKKVKVTDMVDSPFSELTPTTSQSNQTNIQPVPFNYPSMVFPPSASDTNSGHPNTSTSRHPIQNQARSTKKIKIDPQLGQYILTLFSLCHGNVSICYGCGKRFKDPDPPEAPLDLIIVSKAVRKS